ncbi:PAS domain-containing protein [Roseivivax sp. CAU 1761]
MDHSDHCGLAPLHQIEAYWAALRDRAGGVPHRDRLDPRGIREALDHAILGETVAPGELRLRVAGSQVDRLLGTRAAGLPFSTLFAPQDRTQLQAAIRSVLDDPALLRADLAARGSGSEIPARLILLPLRSAGGAVDRVLGGLVALGDPDGQPRRLSLGALALSPLDLAPDAAGPEAAAPRPGFADAARPFTRPPSAPRLRLVVSNGPKRDS